MADRTPSRITVQETLGIDAKTIKNIFTGIEKKQFISTLRSGNLAGIRQKKQVDIETKLLKLLFGNRLYKIH
jgi:hypothetical protein